MKFAPYTSASDALLRERLVTLALQGHPEAANSILIVAPAGYGKTTLLSQIRQRVAAGDDRTAWLNCAAEDREPDVFLGNLGASLNAAGLFDKSSEYGIADLMAALAAKGPASILIDEYENASSEGSDNILETIIRTLPASCRLFVATRELPKISLTKLLIDGRTRFIDAAELRFSDHETASVIADTGLPEAYSDLLAQSEGWPVMVQLARLGWQTSGGQMTAAPEPGHRLWIFDYLAEQILARMEPAQRDFLLEISVLSEVDIPAARAVSEDPEAKKLLYRLLRLRPIVTVISEQPLALRLHPLFREFLRHASVNFQVTGEALLQRRAALHFAAQNDLSKAVDHASEGGASDLIVELLETAGGALLNVSEGYGRVRSYLATLPPNLVTRRPRLRLMRIMQQAMEGTSADWIADFEQFLETTEKDGKSEAGNEDRALQSELMTFIGRLCESRRARAEAPWQLIDDIRQKCLTRKYEEPRYFAIEMTVELAIIVDYGSLQLALERAGELKEIFETCNFAPNFSWISLHQALINASAGDLVVAEHHARTCLDRVADSGETRNTMMRQQCNAILGDCYFEQNHPDLALAHFDTIPRKLVYMMLITEVSAICTVVRCRLALGDAERALADIEEAYQYALDEALPRLSLICAAMVAELRILTGDSDGCQEMIAKAGLEDALSRSQLWFSHTWLETEALVRLFALYWTHTGEVERAYDLAHEFAVRARQSGRRLMAAKAELLAMEAALPLNRRHHAQAALARALEDTAGTNAVRPFLDMSIEGFAQLEALQADGIQADWAGQILAARGNNAVVQGGLGECVSPREYDVLIGLSHGHPTKIIARELGLSHETVRHHLKKIYAKLRVHSREEAVREARRRSIIEF